MRIGNEIVPKRFDLTKHPLVSSIIDLTRFPHDLHKITMENNLSLSLSRSIHVLTFSTPFPRASRIFLFCHDSTLASNIYGVITLLWHEVWLGPKYLLKMTESQFHVATRIAHTPTDPVESIQQLLGGILVGGNMILPLEYGLNIVKLACLVV